MIAGFRGLTGIIGTTGTTSTTGVRGTVETRVLVKGICAVDEGVKEGLWEVDDELGESRLDRNRTLTGVGIGLG